MTLSLSEVFSTTHTLLYTAVSTSLYTHGCVCIYIYFFFILINGFGIVAYIFNRFTFRRIKKIDRRIEVTLI